MTTSLPGGYPLSSPPSVIWLIGGTSEAVALAHHFVTECIPCLVTVTTAAAQQAYQESPNLTVRVGSIARDSLAEFIQTQQIGAILDASHPFAVDISQGAIAVAQALQIPYWRYERPAIASTSCESSPEGSVGLCHVPNLEAVLTPTHLEGQRVLLTLGYRWLAAFQPWQARATLFARILPSVTALEAALAAGFTPNRLIALRPPISPELEMALWQQWQITTVVTKASGQPGGEATKQALAQHLGITLVIVDRPQVPYPVVSHSLDEVLALCRQWWVLKKLAATF